jgi:hypothetical protein
MLHAARILFSYDDGFCERFITPSGARPSLPAECVSVLFSSSHPTTYGWRRYVTIRRC